MLRTKPLLRHKPPFLHRIVHHPDSLTSEHAQRFLDTVTTSFRRNLDQEHSWITEDEGETKTPLSESYQRHSTTTTDAGHNAVAHRARRMAPELAQSPTDHHLYSILSNPLFRPTQNSPVEPGAKRDPMDVFDVAVSKGLMTLAIARGCIGAKYRVIKEPVGQSIDPAAIKKDLSRSGVCDRVLGWLQSSGMARTLEFASHRPFVKALMPFLIAEGKELIVWDWISRLLSSNEGRSRVNDARHMLIRFIVGKTQPRQPVDSAIESIIQASHTYRHHPCHVTLLRSPWTALAHMTTRRRAVPMPRASVSLFDAYLGLADYLRPQTVKLEIAHLHLHHPATPTHDRALEYFDDVESEGDHPDLADSLHTQRRESDMGLDAVEHLSLIGKFEEADSLMAFIKSRYRFYLGLDPDAMLSYLENS